MAECFICNGSEAGYDLVENPSLFSLETLLARTRETHAFKDVSVQSFV